MQAAAKVHSTAGPGKVTQSIQEFKEGGENPVARKLQGKSLVHDTRVSHLKTLLQISLKPWGRPPALWHGHDSCRQGICYPIIPPVAPSAAPNVPWNYPEAPYAQFPNGEAVNSVVTKPSIPFQFSYVMVAGGLWTHFSHLCRLIYVACAVVLHTSIRCV